MLVSAHSSLPSVCVSKKSIFLLGKVVVEGFQNRDPQGIRQLIFYWEEATSGRRKEHVEAYIPGLKFPGLKHWVNSKPSPVVPVGTSGVYLKLFAHRLKEISH